MPVRFTYVAGSRKGETLEFDSFRISIGRASDNDLNFGESERRVSAHHAQVLLKGTQYVLYDLGSTNGTTINGRRVVATDLRNDDLIEFGAGGPLLRFQIEDTASSPVQERTQGLRAEREPLRHSGPNTVERLVEQAARKRANNSVLIAAIAVAMLAGGFSGVLLSTRLETNSSGFVGVAARNRPAVVLIRVEYEVLDETGRVIATDARSGSGFIVSPQGLIVTNRHLIRQWEYNSAPGAFQGRTTRIDVILPGERVENALPGRLVTLGQHREPDVAVLAIDPGSALRTVQGVEEGVNEIRQGDEVAVIGYPLGLDLLHLTGTDRIETSLSTGVVSRVGPDVIQLSLRAYHGNSGGPVLNRRGKVIGILTANIGSAQDITFCTPISAAFELLNRASGTSASRTPQYYHRSGMESATAL